MPSPWASPQNNLWGTQNSGTVGSFTSATDTSGQWWFYCNTIATKPEKLYALEWQNIINALHSRIMINTYYQILKDYITFYYPFTNVGDFTGYGVEFDAQSMLIPNLLKMRLTGSFQKAFFHQTAQVPAGSNYAGAYYFVDNAVSVDLSVLYENVMVTPVGIDARMSIKNALNTTDLIGAQYQPFSYKPRGITVEFALTAHIKGF